MIPNTFFFKKTVPLQNLASDLQTLTNEVKSIAKELESQDQASAQFREVFIISRTKYILVNLFIFLFFDVQYSFSVSAQLEVDSANQLLKEMDAAVKRMFVHFGDDPNKVNDPKALEEFLKMFVGFTRQFEVLFSIFGFICFLVQAYLLFFFLNYFQSAQKDLIKERELANKPQKVRKIFISIMHTY